MKYMYAIVLSCAFGLVFTPSYGAEKTALPKDVQTFEERRALCDHFRSEDPYDAERVLFLQEQSRTYCAGTDKELLLLKERYKKNKFVSKSLKDYDESIE